MTITAQVDDFSVTVRHIEELARSTVDIHIEVVSVAPELPSLEKNPVIKRMSGALTFSEEDFWF